MTDDNWPKHPDDADPPTLFIPASEFMQRTMEMLGEPVDDLVTMPDDASFTTPPVEAGYIMPFVLAPEAAGLLDALPRFEWRREPVVFHRPQLGPPWSLQMMARRQEERERREAQERRRARLLAEHCLCHWAWESNGDPYEDERRRVDDEACPVHGRREDDERWTDR